jgi:hypothetical protein
VRRMNRSAGKRAAPRGFSGDQPDGQGARAPWRCAGDRAAAIHLYLADLFPQAGLAPGLGDKQRVLSSRWMTFYAACLEPAVVDKALKLEP